MDDEHYDLLVRTAQCIRKRMPVHADCEVEDLISDGWPGLKAAIETYDESRGCKFSSYAITKITWAIKDALRERDWVPRAVRKAKTEPVEMISCEELLPMPIKNKDELSEAIHSSLFFEDAFATLTDRQRIVMTRVYVDGKTQSEVANEIGVSPTMISFCHRDAVEKIRRRLLSMPEFENRRDSHLNGHTDTGMANVKAKRKYAQPKTVMLTFETETYLKIRKAAADSKMSINAFVKQYLGGMLKELSDVNDSSDSSGELDPGC